MDYLRTKRDDKGTFVSLVAALVFITLISIKNELNSIVHLGSHFYEPPASDWICTVASAIIMITFLVMLKNGLPRRGKPIRWIVTIIIVAECIECILSILIFLLPEFKYIQTISLSVTFIESLGVIILGYILRKKYQGKIKTLGSYFLISSILLIVVNIVFIGVFSISKVWKNSFFEIIAIIVFAIGILYLNILPWWYESKLLIEGTKYLDYDEDAEETHDDVKNDADVSAIAPNSIKEDAISDTPLQSDNSRQEDAMEKSRAEKIETSPSFNSMIDVIKPKEKSQRPETSIIPDNNAAKSNTERTTENEKPVITNASGKSDYSTIKKSNRKKVIIRVTIGCIALGLIIFLILFLRSHKNGGLDESGFLIETEIIVGDFDGDGEYERLWIEESQDYNDSENDIPLVVRSDNPKFDGLEWNCPSVNLYNLGNLDNSDKDYLGVILSGMSDWAGYHVFAFDNGWYEALEPFNVYWDIEVNSRVEKSKSPGYVTIYTDEISDDGVRTISKEVLLNRVPAQTDISQNKVMEYANYQIESFYDREAKETRYFLYPGFTWTLEFQPDETRNKVSVLSSRYDSDDFGAGRIDNGRLKLRRAEEIFDRIAPDNCDDVFTFGNRRFCVRKNAPLIADVNMDDIEQFIIEGKSDWDPERTVHNVYIEQGLYDKLDHSTHELAYKSKDGMKIKIKLYKTPGHIKGVKAIVSGKIENPSEALISSYEDDFSNSIYSVLTDDDYFYSESQGEYPASGP
ncbi:MAG: hypothetical protein K2G85_07780, partial [Muribaculaceae bacterium]|nr:hypothetical protein [Muribaculaceae bacterium]